jgi:hypothetical protein
MFLFGACIIEVTAWGMYNLPSGTLQRTELFKASHTAMASLKHTSTATHRSKVRLLSLQAASCPTASCNYHCLP